MKQVLFLLIFLSSITVNAQIQEITNNSKFTEIGKVGGGMGPFISSLSVLKGEDGTNSYLWMYNNLKYTSISDVQSITFTATEEQVQRLYELLKSQLSAEKGSEKSLKLGDADVTFTTIKSLGVSSLNISVLQSGVSSYFLISSKQLDKLFGK